MFGHRSDGKKVKNLEPLFRIIPSIMLERNDAQVYFKQDIPLKTIDEYINKKAEEGIRMSYMNIIYAGLVRIIKERPKLNRFVMNGTTYQRNKIFVSLSIKKSLTDDGQETVIKIPFDGTENIFEIKEKLDATVEKNKEKETVNKTDKVVKILNLTPNFLILWSIKILRFLDKYGIMPKAIINASPFHTSVFLTNVGSLGIDSIYHHIYNFGTTSLFFSMGKKKKSYIYDEDEIKEEKCITIAFVGDERICDGHYYASSFKQLNKYLKKPELLEKNYVENEAQKVDESEKTDLTTEAERLSYRYAMDEFNSEFIFVTDFPKEKRAFYHMRKDDVPEGYDLIYRGVEITTGAEREHRYDVLVKQAKEKGLDKDVEFYLEFFKYGCPPHGGFGLGVDRLTMLVLGLPSVKESMLIFRGPNRLNP